MPLTRKGRKILRRMQKEYGEKKGEQVFYASENAGKITGVHRGKKHHSHHSNGGFLDGFFSRLFK